MLAVRSWRATARLESRRAFAVTDMVNRSGPRRCLTRFGLTRKPSASTLRHAQGVTTASLPSVRIVSLVEMIQRFALLRQTCLIESTGIVNC